MEIEQTLKIILVDDQIETMNRILKKYYEQNGMSVSDSWAEEKALLEAILKRE